MKKCPFCAEQIQIQRLDFRSFFFKVLFIGMVSIFGGIPTSSYADRTDIFIGKNDYIGKVGPYPIHMTLEWTPKGKISGTYYYDKYADKKLYLEGSIDGEDIVLQEYESLPGNKAVTAGATFRGRGGPLGEFDGSWEKVGNTKPFCWKCQDDGTLAFSVDLIRDKNSLSGMYREKEDNQKGLSVLVYRGVLYFDLMSTGGRGHDICEAEGSAKLKNGKAIYEQKSYISKDKAITVEIDFDIGDHGQCKVETKPSFELIHDAFCGLNGPGFDGDYIKDPDYN